MPNLNISEYQNFVFDENPSPFWCTLNKEISPDAAFHIHWHEQMEIKYIVSGQISVICDSKVIAAQAGDVVIANSYERHITHMVEEKGARYHMLAVDLSQLFAGGFLSPLFKPYLNGAYRFEHLVQDSALKKLIKRLFDVLSQPDNRGLLEAYGLFILFFSKMQEKYRSTDFIKTNHNTVTKRQKHIANTALSYIFEHYAEELSLPELAEQCFITEEHLCRVFKSVIGRTPKAYIAEFRINKAASLLIHSQLSITEVAWRVGFNDNAYFCRCFKKHTGMSPSAYIKHQQQLLSDGASKSSSL